MKELSWDGLAALEEQKNRAEVVKNAFASSHVMCPPTATL